MGAAAILGMASLAAAAGDLARLDLRRPGAAGEWIASRDVARLEPTAEGLRIEASGPDPYVVGPPIHAATDGPAWLRVRWKAEPGGLFQVFFGADGFHETNSARIRVAGGDWTESRIAAPAWRPGMRVRLDPPGSVGSVTVESIRLEPRAVVAWPDWRRERRTGPTDVVLRVQSGDLELAAGTDGIGVFVDGGPVAAADDNVWIGYLRGAEVRWFLLSQTTTARHVEREPEGFRRVVTARDPDGGTWTFTLRASPSAAGVVDVVADAACDSDREAVCLPIWLLRAGAGDFGEEKSQGVFCGLEYLENEPSSSTADVEGPAARRLAPLPHKVTIPLMAIAAAGRVVGLAWEPAQGVQPVFDSPDRAFGGGGHAMGWFGRDVSAGGVDEGWPISDPPLRLRPGQRRTAQGWVIGGHGDTVTPVVRRYVETRGLPPVPAVAYTRKSYAALAADSWLDTAIREGTAFRHCVWPSQMRAHPAADAPAHMLWLAGAVGDPSVAERITPTAWEALARVPPAQRWTARVGHCPLAAPALLDGGVLAAAAAARQQARRCLDQVGPDGRVEYRPAADGTDYARTHATRHANGLSAKVVGDALRHAAFGGDAALLDEAVRAARALRALYRPGVPRGAQTWEIPLHTPDILAAAHLVDVCARGYELTGEREWLDDAIAWAWTGVPFLYLSPPDGSPSGLYAPIAVLGATRWTGRAWFGRPVPWCGLVFADALYGLVRHDPRGPWQRLADGITASGVQAMWPAEDRERRGLLPDFYVFEERRRDGPAINPLTLGKNAARLFGGPELESFRCVGEPRWRVHVAGEAAVSRDDGRRVELRLAPWPRGPSYALIGGLQPGDRVLVDGASAERGPPNEWDEARGLLAVRLTAAATLSLARP